MFIFNLKLVGSVPRLIVLKAKDQYLTSSGIMIVVLRNPVSGI